MGLDRVLPWVQRGVPWWVFHSSLSADVIAKPPVIIFERSNGLWEGLLSKRRQQILILSLGGMRGESRELQASQPHFSPWEGCTPANPGNMFPNI